MNIYEHMNCLSAWKVIPRGSIVALVDAVRNRILSFVLEIEEEDPDAGEAAPNSPPISQERVSQVFHTHIYGNVGNITEGSQHVHQKSTITVRNNDIDSLKKFFESVGMPDEKIKELLVALEKDSSDEVKRTKKIGPKVSTWIGSIVSGIAQGAIPIIQNVDANLITNTILTYYGLK